MNEFVNQEEEAREDELFSTGDPRRCPRHPWVATSSPDGMFDAPCGECEGEMSEQAEAWEYDPENPHRPFCGPTAGIRVTEGRRWWQGVCVHDETDIPF